MLSVMLGIAVLHSAHAEETAKLMIQTATQADRVIQGGIARSGCRPRGKRKRQLFILQGLPGVGPQRAERLLDAFGTVENIITADADLLASVKGVGPCTAEEICRVVKESRALYGS